jgi:hypothetical protein
MKLRREDLILIVLLLAVAILSGTMAGGISTRPVLSTLAPILFLAFLTWYLALLVANRNEVIAALAAILLSQSREKPAKRSLLLSIVAYGLLIVVALAFLSSGIPQRIISQLQGSILSLQNANQTAPPPTQVAPFSTLIPTQVMRYYGSLVFFAIFAVSLFTLIRGVQLAFQNRGVSTDEFKAEYDLKQDAANAVQEAISSLKNTKAYREPILQCYKKMCQVLSTAGLVTDQTETAREFAQKISEKLRIGSNAVSGLTFLFEEARYSNHDITEQKRIMAVEYLESLQDALSPTVGLPG